MLGIPELGSRIAPEDITGDVLGEANLRDPDYADSIDLQGAFVLFVCSREGGKLQIWHMQTR